MSVIANPPFPSYFDTDGTPLENGYLYFGTSGQNPETNPIVVYWDSAYTQPAAQPIRTSGGFAWRDGSPASIYVSTDFSMTVRDKNKRLVYSKLISDAQTGGSVNLQFSRQSITATAGQTVFSLSTSYTPGNNSLAVYRNGVLLTIVTDYTETSSTIVTLTSGATAGQVFTFVIANPINPSSLGAAAVAYLPAGAGSVATNVQDQFRKYGVVVTDKGAIGTSDDYAVIQAAIDACPVGGTLIFPSGNYTTATPVTINKSIYIKGSATTRQVVDGSTSASGVKWTYTGTDKQLYIRCDGVIPLNGIVIDGIDFRPSSAGQAANSVVFEPNGQAIFGVRFKNCHWQYFGKYAVAALASGSGDVWDIAFENCGGSNHETSTTDMISFVDAATGGAGLTGGFKISLIDCYFQSRAANFAAVRCASLSTVNGLIEVVRANAIGTRSGSASSIIGTHYEANVLTGTTAIISNGDKSFISPATIQTFALGVDYSGTNCTIIPNGSANTTDVRINAGGSRAGTVIFGNTQTILNNRYTTDGVYEVFTFAYSDWNTWTPALKFGGNSVGMTGTFTGTRTRVGRLVTGTFEITLTAKGSSTGNATITGLQDISGVYGSVNINYQGNLTAATIIQPRVEKNQATIILGKNNLATTTNMTDADFTNTSVIYGSFSYSI